MAFSLTPNERDLLSARADQFNAARERGGVMDWDLYLTDLAGPVRVAVVAELIVIDLDHRWKSGDKPLLEEYVERFPELAAEDGFPTKLIVEECRLRLQAGETVEVSSYQSRFPDQYDSVRDSLEGLLKNAKPPGKSSGVMKSHSADSLVNVAQQYQLIRQLGRGMFGEVWLARKNPSGIEKAIKILLHPIDDEGAKREMRSLELIKNLRHPYLLSTEDFWISDNRLHIAMELADSTVRVRFKECQEKGLPGLPADELLQFIGEAAEGLDYLHEQKITHRDVKPDNILLLRGHAKVADFGLARQQDNMMASMSFAGTPAYMAPEVWGGEGGPASDQYSLAFVTLELLQGRSPLKLGPMTEMMLAHLDGKYEFMPLVSDAERKVFLKALSRYPKDRYASCSEFATELSRSMGRNSLRMPRQTATSSTAPMMPSSSAETTTEAQMRSVLGSIAIGDQAPVTKSKQPSQAGIRTMSPRATVTGIPGPASVSIRRPSAKAGSKLPLILGGVVLLLIVGVAIVALTIFGGSGTPTSTNATPTTGDTITTPTTQFTTPTTRITPPPGESIPAGATAEATAKREKLVDGRIVPEWITYTIGGEKVRFRLINAGGSVQPFFMSETKVTNSLYRAGGGNPKGEALGGDKAPVVNVTAEEAWAFAAKQFQGRLATSEEWDYAVGLPGAELSATTISRPGSDPWVNKALPGPVNRAQADVNNNDLIDMAGNGREWTSTILVKRVGSEISIRSVDNGKFDMKDLVIVRGRSYTLNRPLTYQTLRVESKDPQTEFAGMGSPYTSFRVVVPVPTGK